MEAFKGESELTVDHLNRNKKDNRLCNLEYVTSGENTKRACGVKVKWNNKTFRSFYDLARYTGVSLDTPNKCYKSKCKLKGYKIEVI